MLILLTREDAVRALDSPLPSGVKAFLRLRIEQIQEARFIVAERGDRLPELEAALGCSLLSNGLPAYDWAMDHGQVIEVAFTVSDDMTDVLVVPDDGTKPALIAALRRDAIAPPAFSDRDKAQDTKSGQ